MSRYLGQVGTIGLNCTFVLHAPLCIFSTCIALYVSLAAFGLCNIKDSIYMGSDGQCDGSVGSQGIYQAQTFGGARGKTVARGHGTAANQQGHHVLL